MQVKTTRAFRTISEAGEELGLQPHVLRFWESKFPEIKPIKRGGGRRFYRPEDIEFLRGIKILLHDEKHPIKDVQKLIRVKGANSIIELGQSLERASQDKKITETVLIPERIRKAKPSQKLKIRPIEDEVAATPEEERVVAFVAPTVAPADADIEPQAPLKEVPPIVVDKAPLEDALLRLTALRSRWTDFKKQSL